MSMEQVATELGALTNTVVNIAIVSGVPYILSQLKKFVKKEEVEEQKRELDKKIHDTAAVVSEKIDLKLEHIVYQLEEVKEVIDEATKVELIKSPFRQHIAR